MNTLGVIMEMYKQILGTKPAATEDLPDRMHYLLKNRMIMDLATQAASNESKAEYLAMNPEKLKVSSLLLFSWPYNASDNKSVHFEFATNVIIDRFIIREYYHYYDTESTKSSTEALDWESITKTRVISPISEKSVRNRIKRGVIERHIHNLLADRVKARARDVTRLLDSMNKKHTLGANEYDYVKEKRDEILDITNDLINKVLYESYLNLDLDRMCIYIYDNKITTESPWTEEDLTGLRDYQKVADAKREYIERLCHRIITFASLREDSAIVADLLKEHYNSNNTNPSFGVGKGSAGGRTGRDSGITGGRTGRGNGSKGGRRVKGGKGGKGPLQNHARDASMYDRFMTQLNSESPRAESPRAESPPVSNSTAPAVANGSTDTPMDGTGIAEALTNVLEESQREERRVKYSKFILPRIIDALKIVSHMMGAPSDERVYHAISGAIETTAGRRIPKVPKKARASFGAIKEALTKEKLIRGIITEEKTQTHLFGKLKEVGTYYCIGYVGWDGKKMEPNVSYLELPVPDPNNPNQRSIIVDEEATVFINNVARIAKESDVVETGDTGNVLNTERLLALRYKLLRARPPLVFSSVAKVLFFAPNGSGTGTILSAVAPCDLFAIKDYDLVSVKHNEKRDNVNAKAAKSPSYGSNKALASFI
jgi:hypothetical protein